MLDWPTTTHIVKHVLINALKLFVLLRQVVIYGTQQDIKFYIQCFVLTSSGPDTDKFSAINTLVNADMYDGDNNYMRNRANWLGRSNEAAHFVIDLNTL